ncbi:competence protein ComEC [Bizionia arctica]|uniref:Competence protein ComEC n=2 Tax=Bizionia arctica TaxID=1495645 RepID=A0A917LLS9_9FLAO|nr:competence protein ComEC [Bizionia arctica]
MISLGVLVENLHNQRHYKNHYTSSRPYQTEATSLISLKISSILKPNSYNDRYVVKLIKLDSNSVNGLALLNIRKDSLTKPFSVDDVLVLKSELIPTENPLNPNQFNYKQFLENKYIYAQMYSDYKTILIESTNKNSLSGYADAIRTHINKKLKEHPFKPNELAIINALLLGQRQDLSQDVYNDYKNAGALHILAVSGLHVGIILLLLNFVFKPLEYLKRGHVYKIILLIICLWSFAVIAGLSASVLRASLMFSLIAITMNLKRPKNTLNILISSAFILLLFNPNLIFDVGFQLSYLAVIAIVTVFPLLYGYRKSKYWLVDKLWQVVAVSIAAQIGVLPISLFYFHQIPGLFLLSNVVVIPFLGIILGYGIVVIILANINFLPDFVATIYGHIIGGMNWFFKWVSQHEKFIIKDISFNWMQVIASYLVIISLYHFYKAKNFKNTIIFLLTIIICQTTYMYTKYMNETKNNFIVFHKSRYSILGIQKGNTLELYHNLDSTTNVMETMINSFTTYHDISKIKEDTLRPIYPINNNWLLVIDSLGIYKTISFKPDFVLLRNSPKINLNRLIDSLQPKYIIADGSNYKSYVKRWKETCEKQKIPFHQTGEKGAFITNLSSD